MTRIPLPRLPRVSALVALGMSLAACGSDGRPALSGSDAGSGAPSEFVPPATTQADAGASSAALCQKMDILFVIDDSGSMREEQAGLVQSFPQFAAVLDTFQVAGGGLLDYRIGVTSTGRDVKYAIKTGPPMPEITLPLDQKGMNGILRRECGMQSRWIDRGDPNVSGTFACAAQLGTGGPGVEMPLLATELALGDRMADGTNAGFLRDDALLAMVLITDEEDCSRRDNDFVEINDMCDVASPNVLPPSHFVDFLDGVKRGRGRWAAAAIAGPGECSSAFGNAYEAKRLKHFVGLAGQNAVFASICDGNFATALNMALSTFKTACESFPAPK